MSCERALAGRPEDATLSPTSSASTSAPHLTEDMLVEANGSVSFRVRVDALGLRYLSLGLTSYSL